MTIEHMVMDELSACYREAVRHGYDGAASAWTPTAEDWASIDAAVKRVHGRVPDADERMEGMGRWRIAPFVGAVD
jgi:hypothetical protein